MDYAILKSEITVDPLSKGYSGMTDRQVADSLNTVNRTKAVDTVTGQDIFEATVAADFALLTADQKLMYYAIIGMGAIKVSGTNTKVALLAMFGAGTATRTALINLASTPCSRATELGLPEVNSQNVSWAKAH